MKVLPCILFFLHLQDVLCDNSELQPEKFVIQSYPKKYDREAGKLFVPHNVPKKTVQIVISRKFFEKPETPLRTKKPAPLNTGYTAFPPVGDAEKKFFEGPVPASPYFPHDPNNEQKARDKKVLPDYLIGAVRRKRSVKAVDQNETKAVKVEKAVKAEGAKPVKRAQKVKSGKPKRGGRSKNNRMKARPKSMRDKLKQRSLKKKRGAPLKFSNRPANKKKRKRSQTKSGGEKKVTKKVKESRRLIAARDAVIEDYPYVVSIQKNREHWCSGALLNQRLVITTANCIWKSARVTRLRVRAGSRHTDHGGQQARIQEIMKHPMWNIRRNPDFDVAMLLLDNWIRFSHSVHAVDLPNRVMMPVFDDVWVASWGSDRRDGVYDKKAMSLQVFHARLMDRAKCNNVTQRFGVSVTENFICLAQTARRAPCTRDTGAPAVSDGVLWGLASWGIRKLCGTERFPAMFSYLASQSNMDFIINATKVLMADERYYPFPDRLPTARVQSSPATLPEVRFRAIRDQ
ncbi:hypothetical protein ABMA28_009445 [Loxostege sticticalis]|uniref:Peptidase S1 domain-containing protein n=1 Tax=Loxostege sticticalis TaxID=481309 RepID=A0ABD0SDC5_LOXSC